jgi:hypothetical protein
MPKFEIGDKVEIIKHSNKQYVKKQGKVFHVGNSIKGVTQPVNVELPKRELEPYYSVVLDNGEEVHNLKERQLRKKSDK